MMDVETKQKVLNSCDAVFDDVINFTQDMVGEYAVLHNEQGVLNVVEARLQSLNLSPERVALNNVDLHAHALFAPVPWDYENKYNLVSSLNKGEEGRSLVFNGHIDVVPAEPVEMWSQAPHISYQKDGWLYGRGAGDMQSGVAAMIYAVHAIQRLGLNIQSPLSIQTVIEEECTGNGALACVHAGHTGDFVMIPEPFGAQIYSGQIGVIWFKVRLYGKPAHVLNTAAGVNAIEALNPAIAALKLLEERLNTEFNHIKPYSEMAHPYSLNIGKIEGGNWASSVPAYAELEGRIGFPPEMPSNIIMQLISDALAPVQQQLSHSQAGKMTLRFEGFRSEGHLVDLAHAGIQTLSSCHFDLLQQEPEHYFATCTTDLRAFHCYDSTAGTCYGPVAENIHGIDERVNIESIRHTLKTYALFIMSWCKVSQS